MEFGPMHLWAQMTFIARVVVIFLIMLSVWSLYVTIERVMVYRKAKKQSLDYAKIATRALQQDKLQEAIDTAVKYKFSHLARVTRAALIEFLHDRKPTILSTHDVIEAGRRAIERETLVVHSDLKRGVPGLATIATTAPFIGLFGTVIGIINAFRGMAMEGSGGIGVVSAGIAEALVTTALGLFVAIPAAWMFNYFTNKLERFQIEMSNASSELLDYFIKKQGAGNAAR